MLRVATPFDGEEIAIAALGFLAEDQERISRFLALTGIEPATIRAAASEPGFLVAVLDHILGDERLLLAFAAHHHIRPEGIQTARGRLAGVAS